MHLGLAIVPVAGVAGWAGGAVWYGVLNKSWTAALGWSAAELEAMKRQSMLLPMLFSFVAELVMGLIFYLAIGPVAEPHAIHGLLDGFVLWLGFVITTTGVNYAYQRRSLALLAIDAGHWLLVLLIQGALIALLR